MESWQERYPAIGDVRGLGLMLAIELVHDRRARNPTPTLATAVVEAAAARGLLLLKSGIYSNCIRVLAPLMIADAELDEALDVWEDALSEPRSCLAAVSGKMSIAVVGEVIAGRYELEELVGAGGMSSVYRAHDRLLERRSRSRSCTSTTRDDEDYVERFRREARAAAQLSHPNIVTVIDRGEDGRPPVHRLRVRRRRKPQAACRRARAAAGRRRSSSRSQIGRALAFAHARGLVHRDVKPQNVLLTATASVKVTDFGIARIDRRQTA